MRFVGLAICTGLESVDIRETKMPTSNLDYCLIVKCCCSDHIGLSSVVKQIAQTSRDWAPSTDPSWLSVVLVGQAEEKEDEEDEEESSRAPMKQCLGWQ